MRWFIIFGLALTINMQPYVASLLYSESGENRIHHEVERRLVAGEKANRLIHEQSPYLLQHAFNPVDWYPWGEEAFAKAKSEDIPIFLSIGYSTCHWCHVMARESFESGDIAAILNKWFVSIKVDREERPDIDQMYMAATQAMTGSGGWPMSVFLLPDSSPFFAGTYFPPSAIAGRPGFKDLLTTVHTAWLERRHDLQKAASVMVEALQTSNLPSADGIKSDVFERGYNLIAQNYDPLEGGFSKAPKFPRPVVISFLFNHFLATGTENARDMALFTLEKMAAGGMYDQLGGGFHRYSVDKSWFVPHFEKMLYDQAQLASVYLDAFIITKDDKYAQTARQIFTYTKRDMRDTAGGFYSAEDADSDDPYVPVQHGEGAFYLWTKKDIDKRLGGRAAEIFNFYYGVKDDGNVQRDPKGEFTGKNILFKLHNIEETATAFKVKKEHIIKSMIASKETLFNARQQRTRPHLDDKVITAWNGMMIGALAKGSLVLQNPQLLDAALQTATFVKENLYDGKSHTLQRRYRNKNIGLAGQLDDYAYLVDGLLSLYKATQDPQWLRWTNDLTKRQIQLFWNEKGGFFFDSVVDPSVKVRMRDRYDGAEPAGNSVAANNLLLLGQLQNKPEWQQMARRLMESFADVINHYPPALPLMLNGWRHLNSKSTQVVIAGKRGGDDTKALLNVANSDFSPSRLVLLADGAENQEYLQQYLPFLETVAPLGGKATAYVCSDFTCKMPVTDVEALQQQLDGQRQGRPE